MIADISWYRRRLMTPTNMLFCWHFGLTLMLLWWAAVLAYPAPTFSISASYSVFARICPDENFWAAGYGFAAIIGAIGCYGAWPPNARDDSSALAAVRMGAACVIAFVHGMTATFMLQAAPTGTGPGIYALIMCSAWLLLRAEYERS